MIYIIVLILLFAGVYAFDYRKYRTFFPVSYWGMFVILVVVAGLRYRIGTDSVVYESVYESFPKLWELTRYNFGTTRFEPGFIIFSSLTRSISPDFMLLQFFISIIVNGVIFWFILKNTSHRFFALTLYYIMLYLNLNTQVLREALAVSLFLLAWPAFRDGKWIWYYVLTLLASSLHTSALFTLLIPLFCLPGIKSIFVLGKRTIIICLLLVALGTYIQQRFSEIFTMIAFNDRLLDRVEEYSHSGMGGRLVNINGIIRLTLQYILYPIIALYFIGKGMAYNRRKLRKEILEAQEDGEPIQENEEAEMISEAKKEKKDFERWQIMTMLGVYMMVFSIPIFIFTRYFNYFGMFCIASIATWTFSKMVVNGKKVRLNPAYWVILFIPFFYFNIYVNYNAPVNKSGTMKQYQIFYPYYTRLEPKMDEKREAIYRYWNAR